MSQSFQNCPRPKNGRSIEISGSVQNLTFGNDETGFGILKLRVDDQFKDYSCVTKGIVTLVGTLSKVSPGERIQVWGTLGNHAKFGPQVEVDKFILTEPKGTTDLVKYLANNVKYVDKRLAAAIVAKFGENTIAIIDHEPERLLEVRNIGAKRLEELKAAWKEQQEFRELLMFASSLGIGGSVIQKIFDAHGQKSIDRIKNDPYSLARDVDGIGFKKADEIALHLGVQELSVKRLLAGIEHVIREKAQIGGDCFQYVISLVNDTTAFFADPKITGEMLRKIVLEGVAAGVLVNEGNRIYLPRLLEAEKKVASYISNMWTSEMPAGLATPKKIDSAIKAALESISFTPAPEQQTGITTCLSNKVSVLTGGPGVGKSTITRAIVHGFEHAGLHVHLLAPTGRAAKRMTEVIGRQASTIHRTLFSFELAIKQGAIRSEMMMDGVVIVDEGSMVDISLMSWLLSFIDPSAILIFIGDKDQLPSVSPGAVLRDMIESEVIPVTFLTRIFRQAEGSNISITAAKINQGVMPENLVYLGSNYPFMKSDMYVVTKDDPADMCRIVTWCATQFSTNQGFDPLKDCHVLSPMHKGDVGVAAINASLQRALNPTPTIAFDRSDGVRWGIGDKLMQLKNNYKIGAMNGDIGFIVEINFDNNQACDISVDFDGTVCKYEKIDFGQLTLAYATTIHKFQGSECPVIIMVLHTSHFVMLQRNLLYTGITRGKKLVILICNEQALTQSIRNNQIARRNTMLAERLRETIRSNSQPTRGAA